MSLSVEHRSNDQYGLFPQPVFTFPSLDIGSPSGRELIVSIVGQSTSHGRHISSVTVGGVSATEVVSTTADYYHAAIYRVIVPTGTSATVEVTWDSSISRCGVGVWAAYGLGDVNNVDQSSWGTVSKTVNVTGVAGGAIIAVVMRASRSGAFAWTNAVEDFDQAVGGSATQSGAHSLVSGSVAITATTSGGGDLAGDLAIAAAAFEPASSGPKVSAALGGLAVSLAVGAVAVSGAVGVEPT